MREPDWQLVYHAASEFEAALLVGLLASYQIAAHYQGQLLLGAVGELAPTDVQVGLWVAPRHVAQAQQILQQTRQSGGADWCCPCGEDNAAGFELCWACGRDKDESK
ncbi:MULTISPECIES: putative signal transducing protein [Alkalimonas]|uniref:DUF2007 domain-containing protein n=1 Tax=Alkalimonas mucilaginosa TaxID=3057676 RepID=A0ABU7JCX6_9GAMM|nr:DUF2007 domain-containing protein [Alkalimonas sp. MEB004]MEE2023286.1 DUF2007 domain-containing protein [Alkalimonas sp. MEB004]